MNNVKVTFEVIDQKDKRDSLVERVEVLERVKDLLLLPEIEVATAQQVADFYGVNKKAVDNLVLRNKEEITGDGYYVIKTRNLKVSLKNEYNLEEYGIGKFTPSLSLFPKRAILRVGMLLRDSKVAKEVRTQLLNIEEHTAIEIKTYEIAPEMELHTRLKRAVATNLPALGDTFDNSEFESKRDRSHTLEGNLYSSITKSYVNGLVLCGLSLSLLLIKLFANQEQIRQEIK